MVGASPVGRWLHAGNVYGVGTLLLFQKNLFMKTLMMVFMILFMKVFMEVFMIVFMKNHPVCWTGCQMYVQNEFCTST
jgi:hypothetical protein